MSLREMRELETRLGNTFLNFKLKLILMYLKEKTL